MGIYVNKHKVRSLTFPGGECHVRLNPQHIGDKTQITALLQNAEDILTLMLCVDAIRRIMASSKISLTIPYFPYARQDRVCHPGEALSVKVMADLINQLNCEEVIIVDPHSDVTPALLNNCKVVAQADIIAQFSLMDKIIDNNMALISPDAGAAKKIFTVAKTLAAKGLELDVFQASKVRDSKTGAITSTQFYDDVTNRQVIIIDDICDGGRTFIELAKVLKAQGASKIVLYVTHGIFSKGLACLAEYFDHIYCYNYMGTEHELDTNYLTILRR